MCKTLHCRIVVPIERMGLYYARTERIGVRRDCALKPSQVDLKIGEQHTCSGQSQQAIQQVRTEGERLTARACGGGASKPRHARPRANFEHRRAGRDDFLGVGVVKKILGERQTCACARATLISRAAEVS